MYILILVILIILLLFHLIFQQNEYATDKSVALGDKCFISADCQNNGWAKPDGYGIKCDDFICSFPPVVPRGPKYLLCKDWSPKNNFNLKTDSHIIKNNICYAKADGMVKELDSMPCLNSHATSDNCYFRIN